MRSNDASSGTVNAAAAAGVGAAVRMVRAAGESSRWRPPRSNADRAAGKNIRSTARIRLVIVTWSQAASCCARVNTRSDCTNSLSCGNDRWAPASVRRMFASTMASNASELPREDR
ncbi:hypothetical protein GCM10010170_011080 [Dactylosporangium salmoneum]|uniref:Uncharacterized protein n=1 Tax=Dactylosporangium salmoneum TaxID=53361 RepID=A0ABP5SIX5_9ACTN